MTEVKSISVFLLCVFLVACKAPSLESPQPKDVEGRWESTNIMGFIPYMMIDFNSYGAAKVVVIDYEGVARNYAELYGFESKARSFNNKVKFILDEGDEEIQDAEEIVLSEGRISNSQLCFYITIIEKSNENNKEELDFPLCFTQSKDLIEFRQAAYSLLDE